MTTLDEYKLSCELLGHSMDVRAVTEGDPADGTIISGSRDKSVKIWHKQERGYTADVTLQNHTNFVSSVYYLASEKWICTGSNDATVCIYNEGTVAPFLVLKGHESTVCAISKGVLPKTLITGSWDKTARVWQIDENGTSTFVTLKGHEFAVWAVDSWPSSGKYVTASADKMIFLWNAKGEKLRMLKGHTDCVRGLVALEDGGLLSCSNDAVIKHWNEDGECIREFNGHGNYVYTIALAKSIGVGVFITGGEDSSVRMWSLESGNLGCPLVLPAQSVWSVASLSNGDIVTGSSDGVVRVFTKDPSRQADVGALQAFRQAVQIRNAEATEEIGGVKKTELPGPESLNQPGHDGQTKIIRHPNGKIECYSWENNKWNLVGDVMGASGGSQKSSGKKLYEGKEYDYVFSVDISDDQPPLKLPYNLSEDPWHAAQSFIHKNNLPQVYLEQVANFIVKNSDGGGPTVVQRAPPVGYQDPFTGESRYIPGSAAPIPRAESPKVQVNFTKGSQKHFPVSKFTSFDNCDSAKVLSKMKEFNTKIGENNLSVSEELLTSVIKLTEQQSEIDKSAIEALEYLLKWPKEILFPVLDITRLAIRNEQIYVLFSSSSNFLDTILPHLGGSAPNQLMTIRCLANMMQHESGRQQIETRLEPIVDAIRCIKTGSGNLQIAIATFFLNGSISQITGKADAEKCRVLTEGIIDLLKWSNDLEAWYRSIQAIGNLSCTPVGVECSAQVISMDSVLSKIQEFSNTPQPIGFEKVREAAEALLASF